MIISRKIRELVMENNDLKCALAEHQEAIEIIMSKYRTQVFIKIFGRSRCYVSFT